MVADSKDVVADDCEKVRVVHGSKKEVGQQEDAFFESSRRQRESSSIPSSRSNWHLFPTDRG